MHNDVIELGKFYDRPLGQMVRRLLMHRLGQRRRNVAGQTVIGLGYAIPYLPLFRSAAHVGALMPATQGVVAWPNSEPVMSALIDEAHLPLGDNSVDLMLCVHCLEGADRIRPLLRELWRVLKPEGRLLLIVPNRVSIWARSERTPFAHGRPFSRGQIQRLLKDNLFTTYDWCHALHVPPVQWPIVMRSATLFERAGAKLTPGIGGVIIIEAGKELMAPLGGSAVVQEATGRLATGRPGMSRHGRSTDRRRRR